MVIDMKVNYLKAKKMVKVNITMYMVMYMMENGKMIKNMVKVDTLILGPQKNTMVNGLTIKNMEKVYLNLQQVMFLKVLM